MMNFYRYKGKLIDKGEQMMRGCLKLGYDCDSSFLGRTGDSHEEQVSCP